MRFPPEQMVQKEKEDDIESEQMVVAWCVEKQHDGGGDFWYQFIVAQRKAVCYLVHMFDMGLAHFLWHLD